MVHFQLLGQEGDETRVLVSPETGYSVALVGHPMLHAGGESTPAYDCVVRMRDVDVQIGFRIDDIPTTLEPPALALALASAYTQSRSRTPPQPLTIDSSMRPPQAKAGAHTTYPLVGPDPNAMEQLWILLRPSPTGMWALYQTTRFSNLELNRIQWGHLRAALFASQGWDPQRTASSVVWPASDFALPRANLQLTDQQWQEAASKAEEVGHVETVQVQRIADVLCQFALSDDPPGESVGVLTFRGLNARVSQSVPPQAAKVLLRNVEKCRTYFDLRAWAWQCAWAVGNRAELKKQ